MVIDFSAILTLKKLSPDFVLLSQEDHPQLHGRLLKYPAFSSSASIRGWVFFFHFKTTYCNTFNTNTDESPVVLINWTGKDLQSCKTVPLLSEFEFFGKTYLFFLKSGLCYHVMNTLSF